MGIGEYLGLSGGVSPTAEVRRLRREVEVLHQQVALLARAQGVDVSRVRPGLPVSESVAALIRSGRQIQAIKVHREETGLGLAEAKADVDEATRMLR